MVRQLGTIGLLLGAALLLLLAPQPALLGIASILSIPVFVLCLECGVACLRPPAPSPAATSEAAPNLAVLIPAHNEAAVLAQTLDAIPAPFKAAGQVLVVADNCTDETADIARAGGATTIEREDTSQRGKGYALEFGLRHLAADPPEVVVIVDADCIAEPGAIAHIARRALETNRPVQSLYLLDPPNPPTPRSRISALAFLVKNFVRPLGLVRLGWPCLLQGTGMAFPWQMLAGASIVGDCLVEDMQMGVDLTLAGTPPLFCPEAKVTSLLPQQDAAAKSQRTRWEHGHLQTILRWVPSLLGKAIAQRRFDVAALALELSVPPLALLVLMLLLALGASIGVGYWLGLWLPAYWFGIEGIAVVLALGSAWFCFGREIMPPRSLPSIPLYILWKLPLYVAFAIRPQKEWVRTQRDDSTV